ncbi:MAG: folate-binding protein [Rhizomicrobium sp.]
MGIQIVSSAGGAVRLGTRLGNQRREDYLLAMTIARLDDRAVLAISGPDARGFLQGLITNDVARLGENAPLYAALLTPQGKILFDFLLFADGEGVLLDCEAGTCEAVRKRLSMYRLRAKVEIAPRDDLAVFATWGESDGLPAPAADDPRLAALGRRTILQKDSIARTGDAKAYLLHRLELGVPEGADFGQDRIFALDGDLDELHAIAFDKGCYVGQELTARMKHRGTARKRLLSVSAVEGALLPARDTSVTANGRELGTLASCYGGDGFALIRLDRLGEAVDEPLDAGRTRVKVTKPLWLFA